MSRTTEKIRSQENGISITEIERVSEAALGTIKLFKKINSPEMGSLTIPDEIFDKFQGAVKDHAIVMALIGRMKVSDGLHQALLAAKETTEKKLRGFLAASWLGNGGPKESFIEQIELDALGALAKKQGNETALVSSSQTSRKAL